MNYIHNQDDFATEPVRGLPARLPEGEFVLWQGAPQWRSFAKTVFHTRFILVCVTAVAVTRAALSLAQSTPLGTALGEGLVVLLFGAIGVGILCLLAYAVERTTIYTITNKRVVMRVGVAIQKTFNIPFQVIDGAALKLHGTPVRKAGQAQRQAQKQAAGTLSLTLKPNTSIAYLMLWPHVRPWKMTHTQPSFRGINKAGDVSMLLRDAFRAYAEVEASRQPNLAAHLGLKTSKSNNVSVAAETEKPSDALKRPIRDPHAVAKAPLMFAASLAVLTVIFVGAHQWAKFHSDNDAATLASGITPVFTQDIVIETAEDDAITIRDSATGDTVTVLPPGSEGLLRGALRGLGYTRAMSNTDAGTPYRFERYEGDGLYLADPMTGRSIRLNSFGPVETGALATVLAIGL